MEIRKNEKNQIWLTKADAWALVSYTTLIAVYIPSKRTIFKSDRFYSRTTSKHFNAWKKYYNFDGVKIELVDEQTLSKLF